MTDSWADWKEEQVQRDMELDELHAEIERLQTDNLFLAGCVREKDAANISLEAKLRCTEGWGQSLNAALAEIELLRQQLWLAREDMAHLVQQIDAVLGPR